MQVSRQLLEHDHREAMHDLTALQDSRILLVQRLERVVVALALTLDAETATEERLVHLEELAGVQRINGRPAADSAMLAQRYRDLLQAIDSIDEQLHPNNRRASP